MHASFLDAVDSGNLANVKAALEPLTPAQRKTAVNNPDSKDPYGHGALHRAVINGYFDITSYLVEREADVNIKDKNGNTPLHLACFYGRLDIIKYLLTKGADKSIKNNDLKTAEDSLKEYLTYHERRFKSLDPQLQAKSEENKLQAQLQEIRNYLATGALASTPAGAPPETRAAMPPQPVRRFTPPASMSATSTAFASRPSLAPIAAGSVRDRVSKFENKPKP